MIIRKYEETDKPKVLQYFKDSFSQEIVDKMGSRAFLAEAIFKSEGNHLLVLEDDLKNITGVGVWSDAGPTLQSVSVTPFKLNTYMQLVLAMAEDARAAGYTVGEFPLYDKSLVDMIKLHFTDFELKEEGINTITGKPAAWRVKVNLDKAIKQLRKFT